MTTGNKWWIWDGSLSEVWTNIWSQSHLSLQVNKQPDGRFQWRAAGKAKVRDNSNSDARKGWPDSEHHSSLPLQIFSVFTSLLSCLGLAEAVWRAIFCAKIYMCRSSYSGFLVFDWPTTHLSLSWMCLQFLKSIKSWGFFFFLISEYFLMWCLCMWKLKYL